MNPRTRKTTATVLAGSVALASAAYAIGSQSGGGNSGAATRASQASGRFDPAASLAQRLGVSEEKLRAAFEDIRKTNPPPDPGAEIAKALSDALGIPEAKVKDALAELRQKHEAEEAARRDAFAPKLAAELGLDASKVSAALDKLRPDRRARAAASRARR